MNKSHLERSSDFPGGTQLASDNLTERDPKNYILPWPPAHYPLDQTHWKPRGKRTCWYCLDSYLPGQWTEGKRQKVVVMGKRTLFILCLIHHWSLDTLNTFMNGCTDSQFSMLYCFIHNDALKYFWQNVYTKIFRFDYWKFQH